MMPAEIVWLTPLLILPGIALLIVSTSARYSTLHEEIHRWVQDQQHAGEIEQAHLVTRAVHFRNALVSLYMSVFTFASASLLGALLTFIGVQGDAIVFPISILAMLALCFALIELIRESRLSLAVIKAHLAHRTNPDDHRTD